MDAFILFVGLMAPLAFSPGPANLALAGSASLFGLRGALRFYGGILSSALLIVGFSGCGLYEMLLRHELLHRSIRLAGLAYIFYLAFRLYRATVERMERPEQCPGFTAGFLLNMLNVKFYLMVAAVLAQFPDRTGNGFPLFMAWFMAINITANIGWLALGRVAGRVLASRRSMRVQGMLFSATLAGTGLYLLAAELSSALGAG